MHHTSVVIKIGSNILTGENGIDLPILENIVRQVSEYHHAGNMPILVSSGAVAMGKKILSLGSIKGMTPTQGSQLFSSVGQASLMETYRKLFAQHHIIISQALLTRRDFSDRNRYISMKKVLMMSLQMGIIPIINENDILTPEELSFSDNDELASLVSAMVGASKLIILSNIDGLYDVYPGGNLIKNVEHVDATVLAMVSKEKSSHGKGGMESKLKTGKLMMDLGIALFIANGKKNNTLEQIFSGENPGTLFWGKEQHTVDSLRKWLKAGAVPVGKLQVSTLISDLLKSGKRASLLALGVEKIERDFSRGTVVEVVDVDGILIGYGIAKMHSHEIDRFSEDKKIVIHANYFINI